MRLREFDLDRPDAAREIRHRFRLRTRSVAGLYERCFPGLDVKGGWKVLVECVDKVTRSEVRNLLGVFTVQLAFDHARFAMSDGPGQKQMTLEAVHSAAIQIAEANGWPLVPFETSRKCVVERQFVNEWIWPRPPMSPKKRWRAHVLCSHDSDAFRGWLVVVEKTGEVVAKHLAIFEAPSEFIFVPKLGALKWTGDRSVVLSDKGGGVVMSLEYSEPTKAWVVTHQPVVPGP